MSQNVKKLVWRVNECWLGSSTNLATRVTSDVCELKREVEIEIHSITSAPFHHSYSGRDHKDLYDSFTYFQFSLPINIGAEATYIYH